MVQVLQHVYFKSCFSLTLAICIINLLHFLKKILLIVKHFFLLSLITSPTQIQIFNHHFFIGSYRSLKLLRRNFISFTFYCKFQIPICIVIIKFWRAGSGNRLCIWKVIELFTFLFGIKVNVSWNYIFTLHCKSRKRTCQVLLGLGGTCFWKFLFFHLY